jgi:hypothetical protein
LWRDLVAEEYPGIMQPMMTNKRLHFFKQIARLVGGFEEAGKTITEVVLRWEEFVAKVALEAGLARVPRMPSETFLLAHLTQAMNLPEIVSEPSSEPAGGRVTASYCPEGLSEERRAELRREIEGSED